MSDRTRLHELLKKVALFKSLDDDTLKLLEEKMTMTTVADGKTICAEGDSSDRMFIVDDGEVEVLKKGQTGAAITITTLQSGDVAGIMSLFEQEPRSATLKAKGAVELWEIDNATFKLLLGNHPALAQELLTILSRHLRRETSAIAELRSGDDDRRLKIAFFDNKPYTEKTFIEQNQDKYALKFYGARLNLDTVSLAAGFKVVCAFVNDRIDAPVIEELGQLGIEMIAMRCAGYNNVDLEACKTAGISVARVPAYSPYAVAEHAVALMMGLNRHISRANNRIREGNFSLNGLVGFDMHGKTAGVIGTGKIGKCAIDILLGFGCKVVAFDKYQDDTLNKRDGFRYVELDTLFAESDIITLHAPLTPETNHLINAENIAKMKPGVMIINTGRGALIDTQALINGLVSGQIGSAGLDVYEEESAYFFEDRSDSVIADETLARLTTFNNVLVTSHMAFLTNEALYNIAQTTLENIAEYEDGKREGELTNAVTAT